MAAWVQQEPSTESCDLDNSGAEIWRTGILNWALVSVIFDLKEIPHPDIPSDVLTQLENILTEIDFRDCFFPAFGSPAPKTDIKWSSFLNNLNLNIKAKSKLQSLVFAKMKKHFSMVLQICVLRLSKSDCKEDMNLSQKLKTATDPTQLINQLIEKEKCECLRLDKDIDQFTQTREEKLGEVDNNLKKLSAIVGNIEDPTNESEWKRVLESTVESLRFQNRLLELNLKKVKLEEFIEASPESLMNEIKEKYMELEAAVEVLEQELTQWKEIETRYDSLGPKFRELLGQWVDIESKISVKEWSFKELEKMQNVSGLEDSLLGDSFP